MNQALPEDIIVIINRPYELLAFFLSPWKEDGDRLVLKNAIIRNEIRWESLVYLANINLCTPLWYVRLRQDDLLGCLPLELKEYLAAIYQINLERNLAFIEELRNLLSQFERKGIPIILLKGAATFCDELYEDAGARVMEDIDLLVDPENTGPAMAVLGEAGYKEIIDPGMVFEGLPTDSRHHHLHPHIKPGTTLKVEVHYKVIKGQSGDLFLNGRPWKNIAAAELGKIKTRVLNPTFRVMHNTAHAMIPGCEFIRGYVSLLQMAEFSYLAKRYKQDISWDLWQQSGVRTGLGTEFYTYLLLAHRLFNMPYPRELIKPGRAGIHAARIIIAGEDAVKRRFASGSLLDKSRALAVRLLVTSYYYLKLPAWVWRNICYTEESGKTLIRLWYLLKKSASARSRAKI